MGSSPTACATFLLDKSLQVDYTCLSNVKYKDLTTKRFGKLVVLRSDSRTKNNQLRWLCQCDCGKQKIVRGDSLRKGMTKSCGCIYALKGNQSHHWKGCGNISKYVFTRIKWDAKQRKIDFDLTQEYLWELYQQQSGKCALTGDELIFGETCRDSKRTASLDRIDSSKGYVIGNVQWVHKDVNFAKQSMNQEQFITLCRKVSNIYKYGSMVKMDIMGLS